MFSEYFYRGLRELKRGRFRAKNTPFSIDFRYAINARMRHRGAISVFNHTKGKQMSNVSLGKFPNPGADRDAIHLAVVPVKASERLRPGQRVGLLDDGTAGPATEVLGIVDPFLEDIVPRGVAFWLRLLPDTVTGMRHCWQHPAFAKEAVADTARSYSEQWLRNYANRMNTYDVEDGDEEAAFDRLIEGLRSGELYARGTDLHGLYELRDVDELKEHAETYLGISIDWQDFRFTCSC